MKVRAFPHHQPIKDASIPLTNVTITMFSFSLDRFVTFSLVKKEKYYFLWRTFLTYWLNNKSHGNDLFLERKLTSFFSYPFLGKITPLYNIKLTNFGSFEKNDDKTKHAILMSHTQYCKFEYIIFLREILFSLIDCAQIKFLKI
jgi:hypothetical protein